MTSTTTNGFCAECGAGGLEPTGTPLEERLPCPNCGSIARTAKVAISTKLKLRVQLGMKAKLTGGATGTGSAFMILNQARSFVMLTSRSPTIRATAMRSGSQSRSRAG
jgi:hypothetical protein